MILPARFWLPVCVLCFFLGIFAGLLLSQEKSNWGTTLAASLLCLLMGGLLASIIEHAQICPLERDNDHPRS